MRIFNVSLDETFIGLFLVNLFKFVSSFWSSNHQKGSESEGPKSDDIDGEEVQEPPRKRAKLSIDEEVKAVQTVGKILSSYDNTTDFSYLIDQYTANYVLSSKVMFLMRGLPGSGKSYLGSLLREVYRDGIVCSADHYFMKSGTYEFDATHLPYAHAECQQSAEKACSEGRSVVIVDNTNVRRWEMSFYWDLARRMNYVVIEVIPRTPWKMDAKELAMRTKHGVPYEILRKKVQSFQDCIPLYYGWFLNEKDTDKLLKVSKNVLKECLRRIPKLCKVISQASEEHKENLDIHDLMNHFGREGAAGIVHCTAKFCLKGKIPDASDYHSQELVKLSCGRAFPLVVSGFTITPRTFSARVNLNNAQLSLFYKPEEKEYENHVTSSDNPSILQNDLSTTCKYSPSRCPSNYCFPVRSVGHGRSAHITLGFATGVATKQAISDTLDICTLETQVMKSEAAQTVTFSNGCIKYFGAGQCAVYLVKPMIIDSIYSGFY